jgi:hypothetical protein
MPEANEANKEAQVEPTTQHVKRERCKLYKRTSAIGLRCLQADLLSHIERLTKLNRKLTQEILDLKIHVRALTNSSTADDSTVHPYAGEGTASYFSVDAFNGDASCTTENVFSCRTAISPRRWKAKAVNAMQSNVIDSDRLHEIIRKLQQSMHQQQAVSMRQIQVRISVRSARYHRGFFTQELKGDIERGRTERAAVEEELELHRRATSVQLWKVKHMMEKHRDLKDDTDKLEQASALYDSSVGRYIAQVAIKKLSGRESSKLSVAAIPKGRLSFLALPKSPSGRHYSVLVSPRARKGTLRGMLSDDEYSRLPLSSFTQGNATLTGPKRAGLESLTSSGMPTTPILLNNATDHASQLKLDSVS